MEKTDKMPLWVFLAFSSINSRKAALWLILACVIFTLYCIPWTQFFKHQTWIDTLFLIKDWSWFAMMVPIILWYWLSLKWVDNNTGWDTKDSESN